VFAGQQAVPVLDALEGIVGRALLVETKVVLVGLFVLELINVSPDNDTDVKLEEKTNDAADDQANLSARVEYFTTIDFVEILVVTLNQRALGKRDIARECGQAEGEEETEPDEERVGLDHATVSNH